MMQVPREIWFYPVEESDHKSRNIRFGLLIFKNERRNIRKKKTMRCATTITGKFFLWLSLYKPNCLNQDDALNIYVGWSFW